MQKHTKIYLEFFGIGPEEFCPCEVCGARAVDIHHIEARGMGGSKTKDVIENLMALDRACHEKYGDKKHYVEFLKEKHAERIRRYRGIWGKIPSQQGWRGSGEAERPTEEKG